MTEKVQLDFVKIKDKLQEFMSNYPQFKDYDFEGSNLNALLDVLAYNTYQNNIYLNFALNEVFLDTAQTRDAIASHAKLLDYLPRSYRSSTAKITFSLTSTNNQVTQITIPKGTAFTTTSDNGQSFNFVTDQNIVVGQGNVVGSNVVFTTSNVSIYEGKYITEYFTVDKSNVAQRFVLSNNQVDTTSITTEVRQDATSLTTTKFSYAPSIASIGANTNVFYIQQAQDKKYELLFGNGVFGNALTNNSIVEVNYRTTSGPDANGLRVFNKSAIGNYDVSNVTVVANSSGGATEESVESIRFNAPRYFQSQDRTVTTNDYKTLIRTAFPEIQAINVYGGDEVDPPRYGAVVISIDLFEAEGVSEDIKNKVTTFLKNKSPLSIQPIFIDPTFLKLGLTINVQYNTDITTQSPSDIESKIINVLTRYNDNNINDFDKTLQFSKLSTAIDSADVAITSNSTELRIISEYVPQLLFTSYSFEGTLNNAIVPDTPIGTNPSVTSIQRYRPGFESSLFTYNGTICNIQDDGNGGLDIVSGSATTRNIIQAGIGTINYTTGKYSINNFAVDSYGGTAIKFYGRPVSTNVVANKNLILTLNTDDVSITVRGVTGSGSSTTTTGSISVSSLTPSSSY